MKVWSTNEYDNLKQVIVGDPFGARIPVADKSTHCTQFMRYEHASNIPSGPFPQKVIEETEEDLQTFIDVLIKFGVGVHRPDKTDLSQKIATMDWETDGLYNYCPRDIFLVVGDTLIETPMTMRSRFLEAQAYKKIFLPLIENSGLRWVSAPKPRLLDGIYQREDFDSPSLLNTEPVFDAANVLRINDHLFYLVSNTGNKMGAQWLQNFLGSKYKVHLLEDIYAFSHIDSTIVSLNEELVLLNPERVKKEQLPKELRQRNCIYSPEMVDSTINGHKFASKWVGMNLLSLGPNLAVVDKKQTPLIRLLEKNNIEVIGLELRHSMLLGGGFHCVTLDLLREP